MKGGSSCLLKVGCARIARLTSKYETVLAGGFGILPDQKMRILIVEDEPDLLAALARSLRDEGYAVDTAENGEDGLFSAECNEYDAIVLDVMLPKLDGWEVLARLRKQKKTPVLMLTARDQSQDRVRGLDPGADEYVVKPFDLDELLARLRALIRRTSGTTTTRIEIGDVTIDTAKRSVSMSGVPVILTPNVLPYR